MTIEQFKAALAAKPFRPFDIHFADGDKAPVRHPELVLINQGGRTAYLNTQGEEGVLFDLLLVTKLAFHDESRPRRRKRERG